MSLLLSRTDSTPETITIDKWSNQNSTIIRKGVQVAAIAASFFFIQQSTQAEVITVDKWVQPISQPYFPVKRVQNVGEYKFELPRNILLSDWFQPTNQPYFSKFRNTKFGESRFEVPRNILITDWFSSQNEPIRKKLVTLLTGETRLDVITPIEIITLDKWLGSLDQPIFKRFSQNQIQEVGIEVLQADVIVPPTPPVISTELPKEGYNLVDFGDRGINLDRLKREEEEILVIIKAFLLCH